MTAAATGRPPRTVMVLTNPAAGGGHADKAARRATVRLREHGIEVLNTAGADPEDAVRLAREAVGRGVDALVTAGGDGMIGLALQALAGTDTPLGIVPAGTGNDHAREYGLPLGDPEAAADIVAAGHTATVDLGRATTADGTERWFGSVLATGFDSLVSDRTNRLRWPRGRMRYNLAILVEFANLRPLPFRLVLADGTVIERDLVLAAVGNTRSYGGGMLICPDADHTDGLFDLTVVRAMPRLKVARFFPTVFKGTHVQHEEVETYRTASLRIESAGITAYADGEFIGPLPVDVRMVPGALRLLVPAGHRAAAGG
ncbi:diacylglycerol kinase [Kitasatospora sp. NPDC085879]|uniref:diacylglycerol kinase n=1 Tax=Kitasatospora sp. NPDC085879 TaxID=3154769 RepID=UPI0034390250